MTRRPRIDFPGALYHVISRGSAEGAGARGMVVYLTKRISKYTVKEIANPFRRSSVTVSGKIRKLEDLHQKDNPFANRLDHLIGNLIKRRKRKYRITEP